MTGLADRLGMRAAGSRSWRLLIPCPQTGPADQHRILPNGPGIPQLPGTDFLSEQHKDPLFPKPDGGYVSPQGNELGFREPSLRREKPRAWRLGACSGPSLLPSQGPGHPGLLGHVVRARLCPGSLARRRETAQTRYCLVCFPYKEKKAILLTFRDLEDIFNSSSFLPSTGVSYGMAIAVGKDGAKT